MTEEEDRNKFSSFWFSEGEAISRLKLEDERFSKQISIFSTSHIGSFMFRSGRATSTLRLLLVLRFLEHFCPRVQASFVRILLFRLSEQLMLL